MRKMTIAVSLALLAPVPALATDRNCLAEASARLSPGSSLVVVCRNGMVLPARLVEADLAERVLKVTAGEGDSARALAIACADLREIRYQAPGKVKAGWMVLGLLGGGVVGGLLGYAADPPDPGGFVDFGGAPAGVAVGAGIGLLLGAVIPVATPTTRRIMITDDPGPVATPSRPSDAPMNSDNPLPVTTPRSRSGGTSWSGRAPPTCRDFILTETALTLRLRGDLPSTATAVTWDLGYMRNVASHSAVGGSFYLRTHSFEWLTMGFRPRYRHWLSRRVGLDIGPGFVLSTGGDFAGVDRAPQLAFGSINASATLTDGDLVALTAEYDALRFEGRGTKSAWYAGARFGGWLGPVATGALVGVAILAFASDH
jgi:hypothetical protein